MTDDPVDDEDVRSTGGSAGPIDGCSVAEREDGQDPGAEYGLPTGFRCQSCVSGDLGRVTSTS